MTNIDPNVSSAIKQLEKSVLSKLPSWVPDTIRDIDTIGDNPSRQVRAAFTTYCVTEGIQADTFSCDFLLFDIYFMLPVDDIEFEDFENFMLEDIV